MVNIAFKWFALLVVMLLSSSLHAAEITVTSDRDPVALDESFTLTFESGEKVDGDPDFSPLERDFQILSHSQRSSIQWTNGRKRSKQSWVLTVMANRKGPLTVPPILFGDDISTILKVNVLGTTQSKQNGQQAAVAPLFLEVKADRKSLYLQAQLLYTVRFYTATRIVDYTLSAPTFSRGSGIIKKLGDDHQFETKRGGRRYVVVERRYAIFPQSEGALEIAPIQFEGQIFTGRQSSFQPFNQQLKIKRIRSASVQVEVQSIPATFSGSRWLPASSVTLKSEWLNQDFRVGEPVTRNLKIAAVGLDSTLLPSPEQDRKASNIKIYPDKPELKNSVGHGGLIGERQESIAMIPTKEGKLVIPALKLIWWDVAADRQREEQIPEMVVNVLPSMDKPSLLPPPQTETTVAPVKGSAIQGEIAKDGTPPYWRWLSLLFAALWAITALIWWLQTRRMQPGFDGATTESKQNEKGASRRVLESRLKKACQKQSARALEDALLEWAGVIWPGDAPGNLTEMAAKVDSEFAQQLERLNRAIYASGGGEWHGDLWKMALDFRQKRAAEGRKSSAEALGSLYPE